MIKMWETDADAPHPDSRPGRSIGLLLVLAAAHIWDEPNLQPDKSLPLTPMSLLTFCRFYPVHKARLRSARRGGVSL